MYLTGSSFLGRNIQITFFYWFASGDFEWTDLAAFDAEGLEVDKYVDMVPRTAGGSGTYTHDEAMAVLLLQNPTDSVVHVDFNNITFPHPANCRILITFLSDDFIFPT